MKKKHDLQYHIKMKKGDVGRYVILPGDPGRVELIADLFDKSWKVAENREYKTFTGFVDGIELSVCSTGIGCPSASIAVEELIKIGAGTFIRVGTAGAICERGGDNDAVIATAAVRDEGTSRQYMPVEYPAVAHHMVVHALCLASERMGLKIQAGIVHTKDSFYGEIEPDNTPVSEDLKRRWSSLRCGNVLASEMEAAAIFVISSIRQKRAGCILNVCGDMKTTAKVAIEALKMLHEWDNSNNKSVYV